MIDAVSRISQFIKTRFDESKRVLSFEEYLQLVEDTPYKFLRSAAHYLHDSVHHLGVEKVSVRGKPQARYKVFNQAFSESPRPVLGQHHVQSQLLQILTGFVRAGRADKLVLLHGPNGSAKSSIVRNLFEGLEYYSQQPEGPLFSFSWIFPLESPGKGSLGIGASRELEGSTESFARLDQARIGSIVRSELYENPIYLIPRELRGEIFEGWIKHTKDAADKGRLEQLRDLFLKTEISQKNAMIFDALLKEYMGDFKKVLRHVRVERFFLSRRFRRGLVTVEPQLGVDAHIRQVTLDRSISNLPPALQSLSLFLLEGDLIDGNRGIVEYDDILKRPVEHFKYLLGTCEKSSVNLANVVAFLDAVFVATTNDAQLEAFREHPEFNSFKTRLEFIRVPYLLRYSEEAKIYETDVERARGDKEVLPHTTSVLALWAVLTRLKPPMVKNKNSVLTRVLESLTPLAKAKLYDSGELPEKLTDDERRELKNHVEELVAEHQTQPYYEGMFGASARELKALIQMAAQNEQCPTLGPNAILSELKNMVKNVRDFEYLRQEAVNGYFDFSGMLAVVRNEWLDWVDSEVRQSLGLESETQLVEFLTKYMTHVTAHVRTEKVRNKITGKPEDPDQSLLSEFESFVNISGNVEDYRKALVSRIGAWSIENSGRNFATGLPFADIFPDLIEKMKQKVFEKQAGRMTAMASFILDVSGFDEMLNAQTKDVSDAATLAKQAYQGLQQKFGYGPMGAKEVLIELAKSRYLTR